jgi:translation initiation factor eIF-2B subunit alpha
MATARGVRFAEAHSSFRDEGAAGSDAVVKEFREALARAPEMAVAVAAIKVRERDCSIDATSGGPLSRPRPPHSTQLNPTQLNSKLKQALTGVIKRSRATTMMGIERELKEAAATLERCNATAISLRAGCELFLRFVTRTSALELPDFDAAKARIVDVRMDCFWFRFVQP